VSVRRRARKAATGPADVPRMGFSALPADLLDPDAPVWQDDRRDLALLRDLFHGVPVEVEAAVCRLGRWKRLMRAADKYAVEQGWINTSFNGEHPVPDRAKMAEAGLPVMQWRRERKQLVFQSMWPMNAAIGTAHVSDPAPF
jgi:hypothetical protein